MKPRNQDGTQADVPQNITQVVELPHHNSREIIYVVISSQAYIDLLMLNIGNGTPQLSHLRKWKINVEALCPSLSTPQVFWTVHHGVISQCVIDTSKPQKIEITKKIKYSNDQAQATAIKHTFLRQSEQINDDKEELIAIANSDYDLIIVKDGKVECKVKDAHYQDIT